eukprot:2828634-Prymnesium_polylepis.1
MTRNVPRDAPSPHPTPHSMFNQARTVSERLLPAHMRKRGKEACAAATTPQRRPDGHAVWGHQNTAGGRTQQPADEGRGGERGAHGSDTRSPNARAQRQAPPAPGGGGACSNGRAPTARQYVASPPLR